MTASWLSQSAMFPYRPLRLLGAACLFAIAVVAGLAPASRARAATVIATYEGTVVNGADNTGVFGLAGQSLVDEAYKLIVTFDTSLGNVAAQGVGDEWANGPATSAALTIGGVTIDFQGGAFHVGPNQITEAFTHVSFLPDGTKHTDYMLVSVPALFNRSLSSFGPSGGGSFAYAGYDRGSSRLAAGAFGQLQSVPVEPTSAVPEPAAWALMIGGLWLLGGALRVRRRASLTPA